MAICWKCNKQIRQEAQDYYSQKYCQLEMFAEHTYLNTMRKLWQDRLQLNLFDILESEGDTLISPSHGKNSWKKGYLEMSIPKERKKIAQ